MFKITSVGWSSRNASEAVTGPVLLGTSRGLLLEAELDSGEDRMFSSSLEKYLRPLADLGGGQHMPVTGLAYFNVEGSSRYFIIATTANRYECKDRFHNAEGSKEKARVGAKSWEFLGGLSFFFIFHAITTEGKCKGSVCI